MVIQAKPATPRLQHTAGDYDFFFGLKPAKHVARETFDLYTADTKKRRPAVIFVHGGPVPEGQTPSPRQWPTFIGYSDLAASTGLVGVTFDHRLYAMERYPDSAQDIVEVVENVRRAPQVDPDRIALWFFSAGGALAADWLREAPAWLRAVVWSYPVLAPPCDWPGDVERFDCRQAIAGAPELPKLMVRVGDEYSSFAASQNAVIDAARNFDSALEVIDLPDAVHGFESLTYDKQARQATDRAMGWVAHSLAQDA